MKLINPEYCIGNAFIIAIASSIINAFILFIFRINRPLFSIGSFLFVWATLAAYNFYKENKISKSLKTK